MAYLQTVAECTESWEGKSLVLTTDHFYSIFPPFLPFSCPFPGGSYSKLSHSTVCSHTSSHLIEKVLHEFWNVSFKFLCAHFCAFHLETLHFYSYLCVITCVKYFIVCFGTSCPEWMAQLAQYYLYHPYQKIT